MLDKKKYTVGVFYDEKSIVLVMTESVLPFLCVLCVVCELTSVKFYVFCAGDPALMSHLQHSLCQQLQCSICQ